MAKQVNITGLPIRGGAKGGGAEQSDGVELLLGEEGDGYH